MKDLIGRRLKAAREKKGLKQAELSEQLGFKDRQTIAAIEAGNRNLTAEELVRIVEVLGEDVDYFFDSFRLVGEGRFNWRANKKIAPERLAEFEDRAGRWIATYRQLKEEQGIVPSPLQFRLMLTEKSTYEDAQAAAESLVVQWKLGEVPALKLQQALQDKLHALVLHVDAMPGISGAACQVPRLSTILINRAEPEGRRHFDLAHECFHLLTWESMTPERTEAVDGGYSGKGRHKRIEQLADNFAGALLMPKDLVTARWQERREKDVHRRLVETARTLHVTALAFKWRLVVLGLLTKADQLDIQDSRLSGGRAEDEKDKPKLFSADFVQCFQEGLAHGRLSVRRAASLLCMTIEDLADLFRDYKMTVPFDL